MRWLSPFGFSLFLHVLLLTGLGLFVLASQRGPTATVLESTFEPASQLTDDLVSLEPADRAGDPFTTLDSLDPPSYSIEPIDDGLINTPDSALPLGPGVAASMPGLGEVRSDAGFRLPSVRVGEPSVPFSGRQGEARARLVRREGGTVQSERAVDAGVDWLARHQRKDGSWGMDPRPECDGKPCPGGSHSNSDVAATGLGLLPMLGAGHTHKTPGRYQSSVQRGLDWLLSIQQSTGEMFVGGDGNTRMYSHAIATMALCEAFGVTGDPKLREPAMKAIDFIVKAQSLTDGGWRYQPGEPGDTSVFGWQMLALRSAHLAGLKVPPETLRSAGNYLDKAATDVGKTAYSYQPGGPATPVMSAEALLVRQYLGWPRESKELSKGVKNVSEHLLKSKVRNIYYWYYATQLLHNMQNSAWKQWNPRVRNALVAMQFGGTGCDRGSWDPTRPRHDQWGAQAGRHFTTAMSVLTLEVYYRYLPLYRAGDRAMIGADE